MNATPTIADLITTVAITPAGGAWWKAVEAAARAIVRDGADIADIDLSAFDEDDREAIAEAIAEALDEATEAEAIGEAMRRFGVSP